MVEDDDVLAAELLRSLESQRYVVSHAATIASAKAQISENPPSIIILDRGLPDGDGSDFCHELRQAGCQAGILMLTGRSQVSDKESGLRVGADDYLAKPFAVRELLARVSALARRVQRAVLPDTLNCGELNLNREAGTATLSGKLLELTRREFFLLEFMMRHQGTVLSSEDLISAVWLIDEDTSPDAVRTHVKNLRKKLGEHGGMIETIIGLGYKFKG